MDIEITFINQSDDVNNSSILIFQKNVATASEEFPVAWTVIQNCGKGWSHKFKYPIALYAGARDSWGNVSDLHLAANGQKWNVVKQPSGNQMSLDDAPASASTAVEIQNALPAGSINAQVYKDGKLLATKTGLSPQQSALFSFEPILWIGVVSQIEEGDILNPAIMADVNTQISLLGLTKANLIMTGGGAGPKAEPFNFTLVPTA